MRIWITLLIIGKMKGTKLTRININKIIILSALMFISCGAFANTIDVELDDTFDYTVTAPFVGQGEVSFNNTLADGTYLLSSLQNLSISFTIDTTTFTNNNYNGTPDPSTSIVLLNGGTDFYFLGDGATSGQNGAVDFILGNNTLTTEPSYYGTAPYDLFQANINGVSYSGTYGTAVPEPTSIALLVAGLLGLYFTHKKVTQA